VNARPNPAASLISADWGTTSLRVYLLAADGRVLDQHASQQGVMSLRKDEFAGVLTEHCKGWQQHGLLPVLLSGMVGSRQGWVEAPYLTCPTGLDGLAGNLMAQSASGFSSVHIVPGLSTFDGDGFPDGGIDAGNMAAYTAAGAYGFGLGSGLFKPGDTIAITRDKAARLINACKR
jgi:2-keto-3-deoxy-galactonokinase